MNCKVIYLGAATVVSVSALLLSAESAIAAVDCDRLHTGNRIPTEQELIDCLSPESRTRGLRVVPEGATETTAQQPPAVSLEINFEFGSSTLTNDAKRQLHTLGQALNSRSLLDDKFLIEGHTDSVGSAEYNQRLSEKRARTVKYYLVHSVGVDSNRLAAVGRGENQLLDQHHPSGSVNRRVQIVNLQASQ